MAAIEASELVREYAPGRGVCGVSLAVKEGECYALLGRNGSGKSTLTRLILGLERPDSGKLEVLGCPMGNGSRGPLSRIGAALDTSVHWDTLTGWQNAHFVARAHGLSREAIEGRLPELFQLAGLASQADEPVAGWSFGMRRKLSLVEALCHEPELLVVDEPTAGVDEHFLVTFADLLRRRSQAGRTTWIAANDADWVAGVAGRVGFMEGGRLVAEGTVEALTHEVSPLREAAVTLAAATAVPRPDAEGVRSFAQEGRAIKALLDDGQASLAALVQHIGAAGGEVERIEVSRSTLRDAFLLKTGEALRQ